MASSNSPTRRVYPSPAGHYWLDVEASTGDTVYLYPDNGYGTPTLTAGDAIWKDLGLTDGTFYVLITHISIAGASAAANGLNVVPRDGAYTDDDVFYHAVGSLRASDFMVGIEYENGFKASTTLATATSPIRIFFKIIEIQTLANL